jgi:ketosteroid isomerase-like protein
MSQENVEIVRCIYAVLDRGDDEAFWKLVAPDFVVDFSRRLLDPVVLRGRGQVQAWSDREGEMWEGGHTRWQPEEVIDAGDKVIAFIRTGGRGKASGVEVAAYVWTCGRSAMASPSGGRTSEKTERRPSKPRISFGLWTCSGSRRRERESSTPPRPSSRPRGSRWHALCSPQDWS